MAAITAPSATPTELTLDDAKKLMADSNVVRVVFVANPNGTQQAFQGIVLMTEGDTPLPEVVVDDLLNASSLGSETDEKGKKSGSQLLSYRAMKLPEQAQITTVLANDEPLPTNLVFNPAEKTFTLSKDAALSLPIQVKIQLRQGGSVVSEKIVMLVGGGQ